MKKIILLFTVIIIAHYSKAQNVGIGTTTPNASAALEINAANKGFLPPRVALTGSHDVTTIPAPATSLLVYNTATAGAGLTLVTPGYYFYNGSSWTTLTGATGPQGPSTGRIVSVNTVNAGPKIIPGGNSFYVFAGATATITTTATQRIIVTGSIVLGRASNIPPSNGSFYIGAGYQPFAGGFILNMAGTAYTAIDVTDTRTAQAIAGSIVPGAGSWKIGAVIQNPSSVALDHNDYMNLVIMVVEQ
jgi:hypothetical protein